MRVITLEDHFTTPMAHGLLPAPTAARLHHKKEFDRQLGHDVDAELLDLGASRLAAMDKAGIDFQVISMTAPGCQGQEAETAVPMARDANDRLFEAVKRHPDRFGGFAALPTADPAASVKELERAVTRLGFKGALINGHTRGSFLDDRKYWPIFECAQALDVPIYLHPTRPHPGAMKAYYEGYEELGQAAWGFHADTGAHYLRLVFAGIFDTFPRLKIVLGHLGETLPFVMERLNFHVEMDAAYRGLKKTPLEYLRENLIVTTSGNFFMPAFLCTYMALGADRILFSVDWPFEKNTQAAEFLRNLPVSEDDRAKIAHGNAEKLLRL
jgi:predicted TIM-barrel fold metal-dependent hydrolase